MSQLINVTNEDIVRITSREVKDMLEIDHSKLLRKIDDINENFTKAKIGFSKYWVESTYKDPTGRTLREFLVSKKGCEFLAHKTTGEKGVIFTDKYMDRFEEMEREIKNPFSRLSKELQAIFTIDKKQQEMEVKVEKLYNTMTIDYAQQEELRMLANRTVVEILGGKDTIAYKKLKHRVFQDLWRSYKKHFRVNSYKNTATKDYDSGINFIENFKVDEVLNYAIQGLNSQLAFA